MEAVKVAAAGFVIRCMAVYTPALKMADGIRPFQLLLLDAAPVDVSQLERSDPTDYHNSKLAHPIVKSAHIGFSCRSCDEVKRIAEMAKEDGILEHGPCEEGWPGGYCAYVSDPMATLLNFPTTKKLDTTRYLNRYENYRDTYKNGDELWET